MDAARAMALAAAAILAASLAGTALVRDRIQFPMVTHWDARGVPDGWMLPGFGAWVLPAIATVVAALLLGLPRIDPLRDNYAKFRREYASMALGILAFLAWLQVAVLGANMGWTTPMPTLVTPAFGALLLLIAWALRRTEPTWFVGVRTPWTMSDPTVWRDTHRLAAWLFAAAGASAIAAAWTPESAFPIAMVSALAAGLIPAAWSYVLWRRRHPHRRRTT